MVKLVYLSCIRGQLVDAVHEGHKCESSRQLRWQGVSGSYGFWKVVVFTGVV